MIEEHDLYADVSNPLDSVEDVLHNQEWMFNRANDDELNLVVSGRHCDYTMLFYWDETGKALHFTCSYDFNLPGERLDMAARALLTINAKLPFGHFTVDETSHCPAFRHTSLLRGCTQNSGVELVEELIESALNICESHHNAFIMLARSLYLTDGFMSLSLMEAKGAA